MSQGATKERLRPFKPQRFGRYTLLMPLSMGGMGEIFLARLEGAQGFEKLCVIKKILPHLAQDKDFVDRFVDEARILVKLSHGNIAQVLDMGLHEGAPYIALEFIDGKDLRRVVARAHERALTLPLSFILYVATRLLDALAYAHRKKGDEGKELNLVHRDVSPQNILISYEGEVKVIDFGLAKSTMSATHTHPSIVLGKFLYMSPEQARHQKADKRSDLYAVGLCLYELIAGKSPFDAIAPGELMATVANPKIAPLTSIEPLCPPALNDAVMKALAVDPAQRFQTAEELRGRLLTILLEIDQSAGPETATRFMTEAFANEYQSERKLLAELTQQARDLPEEVAQEEETLDPTAGGVTREVPSFPALTLDEVPQARVTAPELKASTDGAAPIDPLASIQALSFQPTRKAPSASGEKKSRPEDPSTLPSIVVAPEGRMTDQVPVPAPPPPPAMPQQSIVLDDGLSELSDARARTLPETRPSRGAAAAPAPMKSDPARKSQSRTTGSGLKTSGRNGKAEKSDTKKANAQKATPLENPQTLTPDQTPAPGAADALTPATKSGSSVLVWLALPVLAIASVGTYIAWDQWSDRHIPEAQRSELNDVTPVVPPPPRVGPEPSREVKVGTDEPEHEPEELPGIAKDPKKPKPIVRAPPREDPTAPIKADINQLTNPSQIGGFNLKLSALEGDRAKTGDATFQAKLNELHKKVKEALAKQNQ
ncbi:MAG: protein kinase [Myxococcales bacterium]|nr:protein kinase [Myxococcales bacterium]